MNVYAKQEIEAIAAKTHFIKNNVEKMVRRIDSQRKGKTVL